jgi:hypothetical protein
LFIHLLQTNQSSTTISNHQNDHKLLIRNKKNKQNRKQEENKNIEILLIFFTITKSIHPFQHRF